MTWRTKISMAVLLGTAALLSGCGGGGTHLTGIQIYPLTPVALPGTEIQFSITGFYSDGTQQTIPLSQGTWTSSNAAVAAINPKGTASALASGSTTITVTASNKTSNTVLLVE
jgi:hypothetical protein